MLTLNVIGILGYAVPHKRGVKPKGTETSSRVLRLAAHAGSDSIKK